MYHLATFLFSIYDLIYDEFGVMYFFLFLMAAFWDFFFLM